MSRLTTIRARLLTLLACLALAAGADALPAAAQEGNGGDTSAVAINTKDGSSLFKFAFEVRRVTGDVVDNQNAAVAYASCTECQTVAISIQVLLISGSPDNVSPENLAVAINENCTLCDTMASAYQFAVGGATRLRFTSEGKQQISALQKELRELSRSGASLEEIRAKVTDITARLKGVLDNELVAVKPEEDESSDDEAEGEGEPRPEPAPNGTTGSTGPATPEPPGSTDAPEPLEPPAAGSTTPPPPVENTPAPPPAGTGTTTP